MKTRNEKDDGDQITNKGIFDVGANQELDALMNSKKLILNINGESIRKTENEAIQTLFSLTK